MVLRIDEVGNSKGLLADLRVENVGTREKPTQNGATVPL